MTATLVLSSLSAVVTFADDTIKVLMLESPGQPLPSADAEKVEGLTGKIFFSGQSYSGSFEILRDKNGLHVINNLPFEKYIEGVVASELGKDWEIEAMKAQAVISRTYALLYKNINSGDRFHLTSSVLHQLYKEGEDVEPAVKRAVNATKGEILMYGRDPVKAFYHATCEGRTELPEEVWKESFPYLKSVECNCKNAPYESWQRRFSPEEISRALGITGLKDIYIASYTATGRARTLKLLTETNEVKEVIATELRRALGYKELPSTDFSIKKTDTEIIFDGKGYGHGVGLSQWGALEMAKEGRNYREILEHFYPGTTIKNTEELSSRNIP